MPQALNISLLLGPISWHLTVRPEQYMDPVEDSRMEDDWSRLMEWCCPWCQLHLLFVLVRGTVFLGLAHGTPDVDVTAGLYSQSRGPAFVPASQDQMLKYCCDPPVAATDGSSIFPGFPTKLRLHPLILLL